MALQGEGWAESRRPSSGSKLLTHKAKQRNNRTANLEDNNGLETILMYLENLTIATLFKGHSLITQG